MRLHSSENRYEFKPRSATSATSSGQRCHESHASPLTSTHGDAASCSQAHQSLFQLPPSVWWAAVAVPHRNRSGKRPSLVMAPDGSCQDRRVTQSAVDDLCALLDLEPIEVNIFR